MPENITIAAFVLGAVMLLISIVGGRFKIFGAEVSGVAGKTGRIFAGVIGTILICTGLYYSLYKLESTQEEVSAKPSVKLSQQTNTKAVPGKELSEPLPTTFVLKELTSFRSQEKGGKDTVYLKWGNSFTTEPEEIRIGDSIRVNKTVEAGTSVSLWEMDGVFRLKDGDDDFLGEAKVQGNGGVLRFENPALSDHLYTLSFEPKR